MSTAEQSGQPDQPDQHRLGVAEVEADRPAGFRHTRDRLGAHYRTDDFASALALADAIGEVAEAAGHHPDLHVGWGYVEAWLRSHDARGVTRRDLDLAARIEEVARGLGAVAQPERLITVELGLDTWDDTELEPFWRAMLGWEADPSGDVVAPPSSGPTIWWQGTEPHETPRQRWHLDIWVPADLAAARVEAVVAAGGVLVDDSSAPAYWVLADPQGNRGCICSNAGR